MRSGRGIPFKASSEHVATSAHPDPEPLVIVPAESGTATDATLSRIEMVMNLLLLARFSAASITSDSSSEHDRLQSGLLNSTLDEALAEQRILWFELAPTMATGLGGSPRYRDVTWNEMSRQRLQKRSSGL
jgi:hypothetical protein